MATLALAAAGAAAGSALLPAGIGVFGATISGATIGAQVGALAGSFVDNALFGSSGSARAVEGPRLSDLHVTASTEGAPIPRLYGRARLGGQLIWASDIEEEIVKTTQSSGGGKGISGSSASAGSTGITEYRYYANFAVALCEGVITRLGRAWADGDELDLSQVSYRLYRGTQSQDADSLLAALLGADRAPAYRGLAYIVFERLPLANYGNRIPQLSFEVYRNIEAGDGDIKGVVLIPGSGEFVYAADPVRKTIAEGVSDALNVHTLQATTDWDASMAQMAGALPNVASVSLVVSWFGTDLRAGACQIKPGVETGDAETEPQTWSVAGLERADAYAVSQREGRPAYGGTPSDQTVIAAIRDLSARGYAVTLTPFVLMDIPEGNALPDPYGETAQAAYPWRGRITCDPAPGLPGSPDKSAAAAAQIAGFIGTANPAHFSLDGDRVVYSGPNEWSYRRMVLHQAYLAKAAGAVDAFLIGTELRGLTWVRSSASAYPFVTALVALAADVKSILGPSVKVSYAADWTEYFGHQPQDGSNDVYFHLDPLWASANIDAIGIDVYWPLADWRDGRSHRDYQDGWRSTYDLDYLKSNVQGGEGYDWYYASPAARDAQTRTPITDGQGKPWVFRTKDIKSWWLNEHFNRPGGLESASTTAWVPQSKPFWFMEIGCPAVDKGANQPNVFVDPKSSESAFPYYSNEVRDDLIQRRYLKAFVHAFDWTKPGYVAGANPISGVTGHRMVDLARIHVYCWDARPYPAFPQQLDVWGDGANWEFGHWLNGRLASAPLAELVARMLADYDFDLGDANTLYGTVPGYVIDRIMSLRDALQPLELAYFFDSLESEGKIRFRHRGLEQPVLVVTDETAVEVRPGGDLIALTRAQETDLPASAKIRYISAQSDYRQAVAEGRRLAGASGRVAQADIAIVLDDPQASSLAETWLHETWMARERSSLALPPSALAVEPGDSLIIRHQDRDRIVRVTEVNERGVRQISALGLAPEVYGGVSAAERKRAAYVPVQSGSPALALLDLPLLGERQNETDGFAAALQQPWPGGVALYASAQSTGFALKSVLSAPATIGRTLDPLSAGPEGRVDYGTRLRVKLSSGMLTSADLVTVLSGANAAAILNEDGQWEVLQFLSAVLVDSGTYELSGLLRGQAGTEGAMRDPLAAGAQFVLLDGAVQAVPVGVDAIRSSLNWRYGPSNRGIGDASYATRSHAFQGLGLKPLSPVHIAGMRDGGGDLHLTWIRRTRVGGDNWELAEVPLAEETERYEIDILDGTDVKRTLTAAQAAVIYGASEQIADFDSLPSAVTLHVCQISAVYGRGSTRTTSL
jgi:hypothetical protein